MTKIGFLSFGHWRDVPGSKVRSAREALVQAVDLAVAAEEAGVDGAYFRVHHFAPQQAAPFPLLSAIAARTSAWCICVHSSPSSAASVPARARADDERCPRTGATSRRERRSAPTRQANQSPMLGIDIQSAGGVSPTWRNSIGTGPQ